MAKFLFIVPPFTGHVNPTLGLGTELLNRGHQVAWVGFDPALKERLPEGGEHLLIEFDISEDEKEQLKEHLIGLSQKKVYGLDSLKFLYDDVLVPLNTVLLDGINKFIDLFLPDVIITDHQIFAGAVAAVKKNIPYVTSVTAPAAIKVNDALPMVYEWEGEQIINFQKKSGVEGDVRLDCSSLLTLVYTSGKFFGKSVLPGNYKFIGPVINRKEVADNFDWEKLEKMGDRPKILVTIGTTYILNQKELFFKKVVEAFESENITVIVVTEPETLEYIPDNFMVCKQVPQLKLMPHLDAVVCHAGHNTVCEAITNAKPLIVIPIAYDQSYVAGCVTDNGAGVRLNFNRFRAPHLKDALNKILTDLSYTEGAKAVQQSFSDAGGVVKGVDYLEELLTR